MNSLIDAPIYTPVWKSLWAAWLIVTFATSSCLRADTPSVWSRGVTGMVERAQQHYEFSLYTVTQDRLQIDGIWLYYKYANDGQHTSPVTQFDATKDKIGILWPRVRLEVQDDESGKWTLVGTSSEHGKPITVTVQPGSHVDLFVQLDAFKPFVGRCRLGRIILTNGQAAPFELKYLLPPELGEKATPTK